MDPDTNEKASAKSDGLLETEREVCQENNDCISESAKTSSVSTKPHSCDITHACKEPIDKPLNSDEQTMTELSVIIVENESEKEKNMQADPKCTVVQSQTKEISLLTDDHPTNTVISNIDILDLDTTNRNIGTLDTEDDTSSISVYVSNLNELSSLEKVHNSEQLDIGNKMDMPFHDQVNSAKKQIHINTENIIISKETNTLSLTIDPNNTVSTATMPEIIVDRSKVVNNVKTTEITFAKSPENIEKKSQSSLITEVADNAEGLEEQVNEVVVENQMSEACTTENCLEAIETMANVSEGILINPNDEINSSKKLTVTSECSINEQSVVDEKHAKVPECSEDSQVLMDSNNINITSSDKNMISDIVEPENTEFVQFSQDKHEDPQIENQSVDAEDPFGADNLSSEIVDSGMEADTDVGFSKLCRHVDNLRAVIDNKNSDVNKEHNCNDNVPGSPKPCQNNDSVGNKTDVFPHCNIIDSTEKGAEETEKLLTDEADETDKLLIDEADETDKLLTEEANETSKLLTNEAEETDKLLTDEAEEADKLIRNKAESRTKNSEQITKDADTIPAMETDQSQSNILPGQDDELCIVPDSMKVIIPEKDNEKSETDMKSKSPGKKAITSNSNQENEDKKKTESYDLVQMIDTENEKNDDVTNDERREDSSINISSKNLDDVINIDEESKNSEIEEIATKEICKQCKEEKSCTIKVKIGSESYNVCSKTCKALFKIANNKATDIPSDGVNSKHEKRCADCLLVIEPNDEKNLSWETMEFCNEACLGKFQTKYGSYCRNCNGSVQAVSLGKYCVRFGYDVRQFCCSSCLEEFKKGLKVCSYCQKDISSGTEGFLAPVGDKGQFKDFCTQNCMEKYSKMSSTEPSIGEKKSCSVCQEEKFVHCEVQLDRTTSVAICSEPCLAAFKFVNKVDPDQCSTCKKFFERPNKKGFVVFYENEAHTFCTKTCLNVFIITNRKIVPCNWCKVKKYNFDMIKKELKTGQIMMMCSLNCLTLYQVSINAVSAKRINCDFCKEFSQAQYHLTMSDATIRNFCSYNCVMNFQAQYTKSPITIPSGDDPVPTGMPKRTLPSRTITPNPPKANEIQNKKNMPVISSVTSLAELANGQSSPQSQPNNINSIVVSSNAVVQNQNAQVIYKQQIITRPSSPVKIHNKMTQCKPLTHTKGVSVRPHPCTKSTQTEEVQKILVPIPVPIYVPFPMHMYSMPFPVPVPFPLPIPVPVFIPTTRNSAKGIFKDIKRIQEKIPADPFEAELLMMAEMVATEKKANESDSDSADDRDDGEDGHDNSHSFSPDGVETGNTFGEDMLQMALKMATGELDEPAVDLEAALTPNTITATQTPAQPETSLGNDGQSERLIAGVRGRKRMVSYKGRSTPSKRGRRVSSTHDMPLMPPPEPQPPPPRMMEPVEKPDANMALKYTFGVNAWRQWVITKNAELEKQNTPTRRMKLFKTDLLQLTADELNYSLCLFVKEVRKPNGSEYAPDTIYYLCLGIQQYLFENSRIDNIFTDSYYEKFTDCLNEVAKKFSVLYNDAQYIVTRVEEEHLWECKQLGAHSPHVLLSTLMFFNTKHFNLVSVEEHMQLSFSHIMKHWKRNPAIQSTTTGRVPGSRNVLLRFYPPQSALEANSRKKKVYEQQENEENPLRCPVKLYEFYLSKCPESVKTRNDVFYLLPERSCVPDSPVWYSTSPLAKEHLVKMLYRTKMVKEINVALLSS